MAHAAKVVRECGADIVDINFGCPAPKVTKTEGGSACLRDVDRCEAIMRAVVEAVDCPVTMKMRLGWTENDLVFVDVARRAQAVGVQALTLHARTAKQFYKGTADWSKIAELKARGRHPGDRQRRSERSVRSAAADARERRRRGDARTRDARAIRGSCRGLRALMEGREPDADAGCGGPAAVRRCTTTARWSRSWASRAPCRRCASTSATTSKVSRVRPSCASG